MIALPKISTKYVLALIGLMILSSCAKPVLNIAERQFPSEVAEKMSLEEVGKAMRNAGKGRQDVWNINKVSEGVMMANIVVRGKHTAQVRIPFSTKSFSIIYDQSTGLQYDGTSIHRNYNRWIANLSDDIYNSVTLFAATK